jgi:hypothetical protein
MSRTFIPAAIGTAVRLVADWRSGTVLVVEPHMSGAIVREYAVTSMTVATGTSDSIEIETGIEIGAVGAEMAVGIEVAVEIEPAAIGMEVGAESCFAANGATTDEWATRAAGQSLGNRMRKEALLRWGLSLYGHTAEG